MKKKSFTQGTRQRNEHELYYVKTVIDKDNRIWCSHLVFKSVYLSVFQAFPSLYRNDVKLLVILT